MTIHPFRNSLPFQITLGFVLVIIITALAIGLPASLIIRNQLEGQAEALLAKGSQATESFYQARQREAVNLALLTAQRPTLRRLLAEGELDELSPYLETLRGGADLDLLLVCDATGNPVGQAGLTTAESFCRVPGAGFVIDSAATLPQAWLLAAETVAPEAASPGIVVVGWQLNEEFIRQITGQAGLEQIVWLNQAFLVSSLPVTAVSAAVARPPANHGGLAYPFALDQRFYYARQIQLNDAGLATAVALDITDIVTSRQRLNTTLVGGIVLVTLLGCGLALVLARRISRPLDDLAAAASALSWHALDKPVQIQTDIEEVSQVAQALEFARLELRAALGKLQQEQAWTNHLLDSIVEGILTLDGEGRVTFFSEGAERITGCSRSNAIGRTVDDLFLMADTAAPFSQFMPDSGQKKRVTVQLGDGRSVTLAVTGAQLTPPAARSAEVALVFRDVTEEEALRRLMGHFWANVTHEFRTPLSALAASAELLRDQAATLSPAEVQELLNTLLLGILGLQTLVDNLLESASIESGRFRVTLRDSDLAAVIHEAVRIMTPLAHKHNQHFRLEMPHKLPALKADSRRLVQVIVNLLSNAIKHGPDGSEICLATVVKPKWVKITVTDAGPGVATAQREDIFHWFMRRRPENLRPPFGVGLGLVVVKAVVAAHNGRVGVADRPGGGSIFWFELPVAEE